MAVVSRTPTLQQTDSGRVNVLGIDPGAKGALAIYGTGPDDSHSPRLWDILEIPTAKASGRGREILWDVLNAQWDEKFWWADHGFLERVMSRHGEGVSSAFKFGSTYGGLRGMMAAKMLPCTRVTPTVWKKSYGILASKSGAVIRASELFPGMAVHFTGPKGGLKDGIAEASLIAKYGFDKLRE